MDDPPRDTDADAAFLRQILQAVLVDATSPTRPRMVMARSYDLNPSGSKCVTIGLDVTRDLEVRVILENQTRAGVHLPVDFFLYTTYDAAMVYEVNQIFAGNRPAERDERDVHSLMNSKVCVIKTVPLSDGKPALRYFVTDKNYTTLAAKTWQKMHAMGPLIHRVCHTAVECSSSSELCYLLLYCVKDLCERAEVMKLVEFENDDQAVKFVHRHMDETTKSALACAKLPLCADIIYEIVNHHTDLFAKMVNYAYKNKTLEQWKM